MRLLAKWFPAILTMLVIYLVSSISGQNIRNAGLGNEIYHINGHFILFVMLCFAYFKATKNIVLSIALTVLYGILDEFHQMYVPLRSASLVDIGVDSFGGVISGFAIWKLQHILPSKLTSWLNK